MAILHVGGEEFLTDLLAGSGTAPTYLVGLGNWTPDIADTYSQVSGEPSGHGYSRHQLTPDSADLIVSSMPDADGYMVKFTCSFTASGADWTRVTQIHLGDGTTLMFSIPITADMVDPTAGLNWSDSTGLLIPSGCTFEPLAPLYVCVRNATSGGGSSVAPKPSAADNALDTSNALTDGIVFASWMLPDQDGQDCTTLTDVSGNALHGTLHSLAPVAPMVVTNSGTSAYNQTYNRVSGILYQSSDGTKQCFYFDMSMQWYLLPAGQHPMMDGYAYVGSSTTNPWDATWSHSGGSGSGVPTVAQGSVAAGPWSEDGLQFNGSGFVDLGTSPLLNPQVALPPVVVSGSSHAFLNQNYNKVSAYQWTSANGSYKVVQAGMMWPPAWAIATIDYDGMGTGTAYHTSTQYETLPSPWVATWSGVSVALGTLTPATGDPTGMTIHALIKVGTVSGDHHLISRWSSGGGSYVLQRTSNMGRAYISGSAYVTDVLSAVHGQVVAMTFVWDGTNLRYYRDGVQVTVNVAIDAIPSSANHTSLGTYMGTGSSGIGSFADDEFQLVVIWKRGLTADEVRSLAANPYQLAVQN